MISSYPAPCYANNSAGRIMLMNPPVNLHTEDAGSIIDVFVKGSNKNREILGKLREKKLQNVEKWSRNIVQILRDMSFMISVPSGLSSEMLQIKAGSSLYITQTQDDLLRRNIVKYVEKSF